MEKLMSILRDLHPDVDFQKETELVTKSILDSFDIVTLVAEVDEQYGVQLSAEDLLPENFNSAQALYGLIRRRVEC